MEDTNEKQALDELFKDFDFDSVQIVDDYSHRGGTRKNPHIVTSVDEMENPEKGLNSVADENIKILILGTFPAKESICAGQYYYNQEERFWFQALAGLFFKKWEDYDSRIAKLLKHGIGLWDIFEYVERGYKKSNKDIDIKNAIFNNLSQFLTEHSKIKYVMFNGENAKKWLIEEKPTFFSDYPKILFERFQSTSGSNREANFKSGEDWRKFFTKYFMENDF